VNDVTLLYKRHYGGQLRGEQGAGLIGAKDWGRGRPGSLGSLIR